MTKDNKNNKKTTHNWTLEELSDYLTDLYKKRFFGSIIFKFYNGTVSFIKKEEDIKTPEEAGIKQKQ